MRKFLLCVSVLALVAGCAPKPMDMAYNAPPPPPVVEPAPPPPPAPMVGLAAPSQTVVVTGMRKSANVSGGYVSQSLGRVAGFPAPTAENTERYDGKDVASILAVADQPVSTFSVDVDTGAYANIRRFLNQGQTPPAEAVRTEELLNYFRYDYPLPSDRSKPFSVTTEVSTTPWNANTRLLRIGLRAFDLPRQERPAANLVFLIDVSGSMNDQDKLPLVKTAMNMVADHMQPGDKTSIVVYAGAAGVVLEPTSDPNKVRAALSQLSAGGSTAGGEGIALAYATAKSAFIKDGINRVIMATDGDFNVGISDTKQLETLVKTNKDSGITLTTLGFGQGNYNEAMMERIADVGNGNYAYIDGASEARKVLDDELASTLFTVAKDVKIQVEFNPAQVSQYRLIGYENRALAEEDFDNDAVDAGDIGAGHQVTAIYEIVPAGSAGWLPERHFEANKAAPASNSSNDLAWVKLRYKLPDGDTSKLIEQPVRASTVKTATAPKGDMAFAAAVAAYGQILRDDKYMGKFSLADARKLAGNQGDYRRQEFIELTRLAEATKPGNEGR